MLSLERESEGVRPPLPLGYPAVCGRGRIRTSNSPNCFKLTTVNLSLSLVLPRRFYAPPGLLENRYSRKARPTFLSVTSVLLASSRANFTAS